MSFSVAKEIGETMERVAYELPSINLSDRETFHVDAVADEDLDLGTVDDRLFGEIPADADVEIKSCGRWIQNGGRKCRGRFYVKRKAHEWLCEQDGHYLFLVHDFGRPPEVVAGVALEARVFDALGLTWSDAGANRAEGMVAKVCWADVIPPERLASLEGGGEA